jgi:hypothetical protein
MATTKTTRRRNTKAPVTPSAEATAAAEALIASTAPPSEKFDSERTMEQLANDAALALKAGTAGHLNFGGIVSHVRRSGGDEEALRAAVQAFGAQMPSAPRVSTRVVTYEAWCLDFNLSPDEVITSVKVGGEDVTLTLASVPVDILYTLRKQLSDRASVEKWLEYGYTHTEAECREIARGKTEAEVEELSNSKPEFKSVKLPIHVYEKLELLVARVGLVTAQKEGYTRVIEFAIDQFAAESLDDASLDFMWRNYTDELTDEEREVIRQRAEGMLDVA